MKQISKLFGIIILGGALVLSGCGASNTVKGGGIGAGAGAAVGAGVGAGQQRCRPGAVPGRRRVVAHVGHAGRQRVGHDHAGGRGAAFLARAQGEGGLGAAGARGQGHGLADAHVGAGAQRLAHRVDVVGGVAIQIVGGHVEGGIDRTGLVADGVHGDGREGAAVGQTVVAGAGDLGADRRPRLIGALVQDRRHSYLFLHRRWDG